MDDVSIEILETVAEREEIAAEELSPLYETVDPDALDRLFASPADDRTITIRFEYEGYTVHVSDDGDVELSEGSD